MHMFIPSNSATLAIQYVYNVNSGYQCSSLLLTNIDFISHTVLKYIFHCQSQVGNSPVYFASQNGHTDVVGLLVKKGADIHLATTEVYIPFTKIILLYNNKNWRKQNE